MIKREELIDLPKADDYISYDYIGRVATKASQPVTRQHMEKAT